MGNKKNKFEKNLDSNRLAEFLRSLASGVEGKSGDSKGSLGLDLRGLDAVKMEIKRKKEGVYGLKLKLELTAGKNLGGSSAQEQKRKKEKSDGADVKAADGGEEVNKVPVSEATSAGDARPSSEDAKSAPAEKCLKVEIDDLNCSGCEDCVDSLPNVFEMTDDGELARVKMNNIPAELEDDIREAIDDCPGDAISIE